MRNRPQSESGFSLLELMIAMLMTLIVSGAIYGLLAAGQTAFRREPEVAELTQSVRTAMAIIQQDVEGAGFGFSQLTQVFTPGLDNDTSFVDPQFSVIPGNDGQYADGLEFMAADEQCPGIQVCKILPGGTGYIADVAVQVPNCMILPAGRLMGLLSGVGPAPPVFFLGQPAPATGPGAACTAPPPAPPGGSVVGVQFDMPNTSGPVEWRPPNLPTLPPGPVPWSIGPVRVIRYRVALSGDPQDVVPCLWRSESGGRVGPGYAAVDDPPSASAAWQLIARGVEDMQVQYVYENPAPPFDNAPRAVTVPPLGLVLPRRVLVTLSARSTAQNLQGMMPPGANTAAVPNAVRVQITSEISPRAALLFLQQFGEWQ